MSSVSDHVPKVLDKLANEKESDSNEPSYVTESARPSKVANKNESKQKIKVNSETDLIYQTFIRFGKI